MVNLLQMKANTKLSKFDKWVYNNNIKYHLYTKMPLLVLVVFYVVFFMES